ncbi:MAG: nuclear transport factor 2 family protein [Hyphomicrobiales bacterium]|nr:nuclear transport factor 2 family protein [Hyphomicrobiales bacterium]
MPTENDLRDASDTFYAALSSMATGDAGSMAGIWTNSAEATAQHPIGGRDVGSDAVLASFGKVASIARGGSVEIVDRMIQVSGDVAVETGVEKGKIDIAGHHATIDHRVTNVYRKEAGGWKLVHHHTDLSPSMLDVLAKLG